MPCPPAPRPPPPPSMIVLEICLLCDLTSTFTDKTVRRSQNLDPHTKGRAVQSSGQWRVGNGYTRVYQKALWVEGFFFQIIFVPRYGFLYYVLLPVFLYLTLWMSLYVPTYIHVYMCVYTHTHVPSFGSVKSSPRIVRRGGYRVVPSEHL